MFKSVAFFVGVVIVIVAAYQVYTVIKGYRAATGTPWQRFLAAFSDSLTILWARLVAFASALFAFGVNFLPTLDPTTTVGQALQGVLKPEYTPYYMLVMAVLFELFRRRRGSADRITPPVQVQP